MGRSRQVRAGLCLAVAGLLAGGAVLVVRAGEPAGPAVTAAPRGDAPECARIARGYPSSLGGQERSGPRLAGVAAWGEGAVVLRCGLEPPAPTVDRCLNVNGVDWVLEDAKFRDGRKVLITYGRDPAVELAITDRAAQTDTALVELSRAVQPIRQIAKCVGDTDV
ncbi:DUF3515 domain-containing protein [Streptomyces sp. NBC_01275]|uniref:DUF3515 domain-containing protein n=1 Tax=Streptomyces sp. NBC_01275 TaxID=2903807 RepID=UPI0022580C1C|nr:DUF3515 domain-containing protein [Streptomyces sp. NBC_01275]MCX4765670.1 DUF3515 domain-containing protein [Streptomyces sp. NBC_01275]